MSGIHQAVISTFISTGPAIGDAYEGGFYAGQISTSGNGIADFNLVVAPKSSGENSLVEWKTVNSNTSGTSSVIDGPTNSANMNNATHPAAQFCKSLTIGGYSDWYMPARNELEVCYYNLKPTTTQNAASGINTNAVPSRSVNYQSGIPGRTSASAFQSGGAEAFDTGLFYWSSTQGLNNNQGNGQYFTNGMQVAEAKYAFREVRAIRRVAV
jgi:hypothetical protein